MKSLRQRLLVSALLSVPVIAMAMVPALQFTYWQWQWLSLTLAAPVVAWGGWPFHRAAWANLRYGASTMDTLISLGTLAALGWPICRQRPASRPIGASHRRAPDPTCPSLGRRHATSCPSSGQLAG